MRYSWEDFCDLPDKEEGHTLLILTVEDKVLEDLKHWLTLTWMCGKEGSVLEAFAARIIREHKNGKMVIDVRYKDDTRGQ